MDKDTRNAIERATQRARKLLEEDFAGQLEGDFDVHRNGELSPQAGGHLSVRQAFQRDRIVAAIEHKRAAGMTAADAVGDYLRDAAFTTLNRFVALKMLEARALVQECITKGEQSAGFREFCGMAPGLALLPDNAGYRLYIESLFDELSTEVKVLFDRRDTSSALWPKRATFEQLLQILNADDLDSAWNEDETIGWVYQYFNAQEERRKMREQSSAPRNGRELAIRNQFFTPRYVVQFLTDNTLGRLWYQMRGTNTALGDCCNYLVKTPLELMPRLQKDPRDIRILDPACGSGHFLLYAFDLFLVMYEEAYTDPRSPKSEVTGRTLAEDYASIDAVRMAAPALILAHNLHGVDIDPRCTQIAAVALWLRAQRALSTLGVQAKERSPIVRTHIIVAEPIPGSEAIIESFASGLEPPLLHDLFTKMVAEMHLAGEMGPLIQVEKGIADALDRAREQYLANELELRKGYLPTLEPSGQRELHLSGIDDARFFHEAETRIITALRGFVDSAAEAGRLRRRLFAGDAAQGISLIDLLRTRFDVVLMNPPFGAVTLRCKRPLADSYPRAKHDILAAFVERAIDLLRPGGLLGAVTNRTVLFLETLSDWRRRNLLSDAKLQLMADLGYGVLDSAMVEVAAYVVVKNPDAESALCMNLLGSSDKAANLKELCLDLTESRPGFVASASSHFLKNFERLPDATISHQVPDEVLHKLFSLPGARSSGYTFRKGMETSDDFRFLRLRWEVPAIDSPWVAFAKGGEYAPFVAHPDLVIDWTRDGHELKAFAGAHNAHWSRTIRSPHLYFRSGLTYSERTTSGLSLRLLPEGGIFSAKGPAVFADSHDDDLVLLGVSYSRPYRLALEILLGAGDVTASGTAARDYRPGLLAAVPIPPLSVEQKAAVSHHTAQCIEATLIRRRLIATDPSYVPLIERLTSASSVNELVTRIRRELADSWLTILAAVSAVNDICESAAEFDAETAACAEVLVGRDVWKLPATDVRSNSELLDALKDAPEEEVVDQALSRLGGSRQVLKKYYAADRRVEILCLLTNLHPTTVLACLDHGVDTMLRTVVGQICEDAMLAILTPERGPTDSDDLARSQYPICVDDEGHRHDYLRLLKVLLEKTQGGPSAESKWQEVLVGLRCGDDSSFRMWHRQAFFAEHLSNYSSGRRQAPVLWQIATPSARYSVWLYLHALTSDTLFRVQNDYAVPKLGHEERRLETMAREFRETNTAGQRRELAAQESLVDELRAFLEELKRVAPLWNPNVNDGVVINFAPLWRLVPHQKAWQKELKQTWDALCAAEYDWSHLAMHLWPERVVPRCADDRSLAVAHGLEDVFWMEDSDGKWTSREKPSRSVNELVRERTSPAVKSALKNLLQAPVTIGDDTRGRRGKRRPAVAVGEDA